ncbi:HET-domain-containing protein, partial [Thozetella sp. PMI_491]
YAALSHCWGGANPLRTTKSTLQSHQASVQFGPDSLTFAQAADVTRSLGIRYLWIDSLCIVQDDRDDWEAEAAKMKQVYRDATVTLSADGASDSSKGLFSAGTLPRVSAHQTMAITTLGPNGEPLSTRAWVLQERVLSPRIIHFYEEELVWSCQSQQRCECRLLPTTPSSLGGFRRLLAILPGPKSARDLILEWPKLVEEFTGKAITFAEDRLPAISGLAALMHERTESKYLAGLWSKDLEYSLLWIS